MPEIQRYAFDECDEDIAKLYLRTASHQLRKMGASKSMKEVQHLAHKLSGASAYLGVMGMVKLLRALEHAASRECSNEAGRFIGLLKKEFSDVQRQCELRFR